MSIRSNMTVTFQKKSKIQRSVIAKT